MTARGDRRAGFTLVETLVTVAVVAGVSLAIQQAFVSTRRALDRAASVMAAERVARGIVETRLDELAPRVGRTTGETDGRGWSVTAETLDLPFPPPPPPQRSRTAVRTSPTEAAPAQEARRASGESADNAEGGGGEDENLPETAALWRPLRVTVEIGTGGAPFKVETVHLVRAEQR